MESAVVDERADEEMDAQANEDSATDNQTASQRLRAAREAAGLSLADVAAKTRVPMRHLEAIEEGEFATLPGATYILGFSRSYARAVGLDATTLTDQLREELAEGGLQPMSARQPAYEPTDPARVPSFTLAWGAAALAAVFLAAYFIWRSFALSPDAEPKPTKPVAEAPITANKGTAAPAAAPAATNGTVKITATDSVWVKIYDADNVRLYENEMQPGDSFTVPGDANNPMIVTGRPQVLTVTIDGKPVPPLGTGERSIADVGVSAAALMARPAPAANTGTAGSVAREGGAPAQ
jgi:cytoskeletal protein RodZ